MLRNISIFVQTSILFAFAFTSFLAVSLFYVKIQPGLESIRQYNVIVGAIGKMRQYNASIQDILGFLEEEGFYEVPVTDAIKQKLPDDTQIPHVGSFNINVIQDGSKIFIILQTPTNLIVYQDPIAFDWSKYHMVTMLGAIILVIVYAALIRQLMPLNNVKNEIVAMASNNEFTKITSGLESQNEIGEVIREFNRLVVKLNAVGEARTFFLRSIMHELKTPITKGRIVAEMVQNEKQKQRLCNVFERLNILIDEFAKLEQLASKNYNMKVAEIPLHDIMNEAMNMLLINPGNQDSVIFEDKNEFVRADFTLFALSIKNLLDNAIKYSPDSKVIVQSFENDLIIKNRGNPLKLDINEYFKPYSKDVKNPSSPGFGLGMYIIKITLDIHNFELHYSYQDDFNVFTIKNCVIESFCAITPVKRGVKQAV